MAAQASNVSGLGLVAASVFLLTGQAAHADRCFDRVKSIVNSSQAAHEEFVHLERVKVSVRRSVADRQMECQDYYRIQKQYYAFLDESLSVIKACNKLSFDCFPEEPPPGMERACDAGRDVDSKMRDRLTDLTNEKQKQCPW